MKILGMLLIVGVTLYLFVISFSYLWWFWMLLLGFFLLVLSKEKNKEKENPINESQKFSEEFLDDVVEDCIDEDKKQLMEDHCLDEDSGERVGEIMDEYGVDENEALMIEEE